MGKASEPETFGARLQRLRQDAGLSIYALAKASGIDQTQIGRLERGMFEPKLSTAQRLAHALGRGLAVWDD